VTSNRIHRRVAQFLRAALADSAHLRLAHGTSWLDDSADLRLSPARAAGGAGSAEDPWESALDARSWFASSKHALLAPYGVGTIDQALQGMVAVKHFFVRRFALAGKVVILDEVHSYDVYTGTLVTALVRELLQLGCTVIVLSATLTAERRRELLAAAGSTETPPANPAYPLLSIAPPSAPVVQIAASPPPAKTIQVRAGPIGEEETLAELIARAEAGQHVLWIRNTVADAQAAFRCVRGDTPVAADPAAQVALGLLHSRFPHCRRQTLEDEWLDRLGKRRRESGPGSVLIATQVVEQSVDIDLDFIVSDLAPTDMLLQRLGRLWRHPRDRRTAPAPEFWVRMPELPPEADLATLARTLGRSGKVYAPWVLLRSAATFRTRSTLVLPADIRPLLEATYASPRSDEPAAWHEAHAKLEKERSTLILNAEAAMRVLGLPCLDDDAPKALTRRAGPPTTTVLLLAALEPLPGRTHRLVALDGATHVASDFEWTLPTARFLHPWLVRVPRWVVAASAPRPDWLRLHVPGGAVLALVGDHGRLVWDGEPAAATYHPDFGVQTAPLTASRPATTTPVDDDEFDY
jgi:CRISPR-associated endonuclease/helicase Cas3